MRFRKLRIAWSVVWGLAAVLLIVLWVRSYWVADSFQHAGPTTTVINLNPGVIDFSQSEIGSRMLGRYAYRWRHTSRESPERPTRSFGWLWEGTDFAIRIPVWLCVVVLAGAGALPWIRRFSLRTLLIATTLVAVVLGLIVWLGS